MSLEDYEESFEIELSDYFSNYTYVPHNNATTRIKIPVREYTGLFCYDCVIKLVKNNRYGKLKYMTVEDNNSDFPACWLCGQYSNSDLVSINFLGKYLKTDSCDCGSQIRHNNGGNYHYSYYKVFSLTKINF